MLYSCHFFLYHPLLCTGFRCCVVHPNLCYCLSQIESKSGTVVLHWVNGQLERIETWVKRAAEQEVNTLIAKKHFFLIWLCLQVCTSILLGMPVYFVFTALVIFSSPVTCLCFLTLLLYSSSFINFLQDFIDAKFYTWQAWDPISPQQRHGGSIVEVYRIIEEVLLLSFIISLKFCYVISLYRSNFNVVSLRCHNISKLFTCLVGFRYDLCLVIELPFWKCFLLLASYCRLQISFLHSRFPCE